MADIHNINAKYNFDAEIWLENEFGIDHLRIDPYTITHNQLIEHINQSDAGSPDYFKVVDFTGFYPVQIIDGDLIPNTVEYYIQSNLPDNFTGTVVVTPKQETYYNKLTEPIELVYVDGNYMGLTITLLHNLSANNYNITFLEGSNLTIKYDIIDSDPEDPNCGIVTQVPYIK